MQHTSVIYTEYVYLETYLNEPHSKNLSKLHAKLIAVPSVRINVVVYEVILGNTLHKLLSS